MSAPGKLSKLTKLSKLSKLSAFSDAFGLSWGASCSRSGSFSDRPERCIYKLLTKRPRKSIARFSGNRFSKPFLLLFEFFGEQSAVLKLLKFIPVRYLKFSACRTGSAVLGGPVLQYCGVTAVAQARL